MACSDEYIDFLCSQLEGVGVIRKRKMFGDYCIYVDEKPIILACDEIAYIKKHEAIAEMMKDAELGYPYDGSKEHYILDIEHTDKAKEVIRPTAEQIAEVERKMNELIAMDLPVTYEFVTRDNIPEGVKLDKLPEDASVTLRLVRIGDYDICPCIGQHVESTKEIGTFKITSMSFNDGSFRIVFKVNTEKQ